MPDMPSCPPERSSGWHSVLSSGARRLVVLILALGLLTVAGAGVAAGAVVYSARHREVAIGQLNAALTRHNNAVAREQHATAQLRSSTAQITSAHVTLESAMNTIVGGSKACLTLSCFAAAAVHAAGANDAFVRTLRGISFPAGAGPVVKKFVEDGTANGQAWMYMSHAGSLTDYGNRAGRAEKSGHAFDGDYSALITSLNQAGAALDEEAAALNSQAAALQRRGKALNVPVRLRMLSVPAGPALT